MAYWGNLLKGNTAFISAKTQNMKKVFLTWFLLYIVTSVSAQAYHPFPEDQAVWHIATWDDGCPIPFPCVFDEYYYNGDTVVNTYLYHKLYHRYEYLGNVSTYSYFEAMIRQDSLQKEVYYFPFNAIQEYLLYDFNLAEGDWYPFTFNHGQNGGDSFLVYKIDSILLNDGYRKRYRLLPPVYSGDTISIIEGIGATSGLFNSIYHYLGWEHYTLLLCSQENSETTYNPYGDEYCTILSVDDIPGKNLRITIVPNPTSTTITLSLPSNQNTILSIFNLLSEKVKEEKVTGNQVTMDVSSLPQGLYLVRTENNVVGKFVKE